MGSQALVLLQDIVVETGSTAEPTTITSTDEAIKQHLRILNAAWRQLVRLHPWQALQRTATIVTTAAQTYTLPTDFGRIINQTIWDRSNRWPLVGPKTPQEWEWLTSGWLGAAGWPQFRYRIRAGRLELDRVPTAGLSLVFEYISKNWVLNANGVDTYEKFINDSDTAYLDDRLLILAGALKWKGAKGFTDPMLEHEFRLQFDAVRSQDAGAPVLSISPPRGDYYLITGDNAPDGNWG